MFGVTVAGDTRPSSREEAKASGSKRYFTGKPCKHGHIAPRYTINSACVVCTLESKQRRKQNDPEAWREIARAERRRAFEKDPERVRSHTRNFMRRWRAANPEKARQMMKEWRAANPEKAREHDANNSAKRRLAEGRHTTADVKRRLLLQGFKCADCGKSVKSEYHVDHITPIALGGSNWPSNLQILCPSCNQHKHAKHPLDWAKEKGRLV